MTTRIVKILAATFALMAASVLAAAAARAEGENVGDTQQCINLMQIDSTPVIDTKTILVEMKGKGFKRIDLVNNCTGLKFNGFSYSTSINRLCTSDPLKVIDPVGQVCMIDKIVTIDQAEAEALRARKINN
jgi:hypothetical protein